MTAWHLARDGDGTPTLWHGDTAVLRPADLRVPAAYADALFAVLVAVYTRPDEPVERVARALRRSVHGSSIPTPPWSEAREPLRDAYRVDARTVLLALAVPPDTPPVVADGDRVDYVQAAHVAGAATALEWTERLGEPVGEVGTDG